MGGKSWVSKVENLLNCSKLSGAKRPHNFFTIVCIAKGGDYFIFNSKINVLSAAEYFAEPVIRDTGRKRKQREWSEQDGKQLDNRKTISFIRIMQLHVLFCTVQNQ